MGFLIAIESFLPAVQVSKMNIYSPFAPFNEIVDSFPIIKASEWMRRVFAQHIDSRARSYCLHFVKRIYALEFLFLCSLSTSTPARRERKEKKSRKFLFAFFSPIQDTTEPLHGRMGEMKM